MENKHVLIIIAVLIIATVASIFALATMTVNPVVKPPINATGVNDTDNETVATVVTTDSDDDEEDNDTADEASDGTSFDDEDTTFPEDDPYYYPEEDVEYPEYDYENEYYY